MSLGYPVCSATSASTAASTGSTPGTHCRPVAEPADLRDRPQATPGTATGAGRFGARSRTNPITARNVG